MTRAPSDGERVTSRRRRVCLSRFLAAALLLGTNLATHGTSTSAADDRKAVAALDTEYQAAVKRNDAATMARILADDFVLVTGSGKTYTKSDMLEDAQRETSTNRTTRMSKSFGYGATRPWSRQNCGRNLRAMGSHSTTSFGLLIHTCARQLDGNMCLANLHCRCPPTFSEAI